MTTRSRSRTAAIVGVIAVAGIGGGVAYAYPSNVPLTVAATPGPVVGGNTTVTVTVSNVNPTCTTSITVDGVAGTIAPGATTTTVTVPATAGRHRVRARNTGCTNGDKERARSDFTILNGAISNDSTGQVKKNIKFDLTGLAPVGATVTVTAVRSGGGANPLPDADTVDRRGEAKVKFKFTQTGTYAITATINGSVVGTSTITIN